MKTHLLTSALAVLFATSCASAQDITTVSAQNTDISDNLDLKAVASIFGDSKDLADFERRLNDPKLQISNLDLNNDYMVDYLRVIEKVEKNTHLIILQSVIGKDLFQDVATIEVEKDSRNRVQVQVVGNVYMYGHNYIYEPVYVVRPMIYNTFWVRNYRPYYSNWYYNYYPSYYYAWTPYPVYKYHSNVHYHINTSNYYYYADTRKSTRAVALHRIARANAYEVQNPGRSFATRNAVANKRELVAVNTTRNTTRTASPTTINSSTSRNATNYSASRVRSSTGAAAASTRSQTTRTPVTESSSNSVRTTEAPSTKSRQNSTNVNSAARNTPTRTAVTPTSNSASRASISTTRATSSQTSRSTDNTARR